MIGWQDSVTLSIEEDSCVSLGTSLRGIVENLRAGMTKSVSEAFVLVPLVLNSM